MGVLATWLAAKINQFLAFMGALTEPGGPSSTRWIYLRSSEVFWFGWLMCVIVLVYRYARFGTTDAGLLTLIGTLAAAGFAFVQNAQNTKTLADAQTKDSSSITTPLSSSVQTGDAGKQNTQTSS